jgi:hypothetical protein
MGGNRRGWKVGNQEEGSNMGRARQRGRKKVKRKVRQSVGSRLKRVRRRGVTESR